MIRWGLLMTGLCLLSATSTAAVRVYEASVDTAEWQSISIPRDTTEKLQCRLYLGIPQYGAAIFAHPAGDDMQFFMRVDRKVSAKKAALYSLPSPWQSQPRSKKMANVKVGQHGAYFKKKGLIAWDMIAELEKGYRPTLNYVEKSPHGDEVEVRLSPVSFQSAYNEYLDCEEKLLPFAYKDVKTTKIYFGFDDHGLTDEAKQQLERLKRYVVVDKSIKNIRLDAHTDSKGRPYYNNLLAKKRARSVQEALMEMGIQEALFKTRIHGEARPIADNLKFKGRTKNRRVIVTLVRE